MKTLNFVASGLIGDFIHSIVACKNICEKENVKANLYIAEGWLGDPFRFGVQKAFDDTRELIQFQSYINKYEILPSGFSEPIINLNKWRTEVHDTYKKIGGYNKCWTRLMSETFDYPIKEYKWLSVPPVDELTTGRIVVHRSRQRHNHGYVKYMENIGERVVFLTCNPVEFDEYEFKNISDRRLVSTFTEMAIAIRSSRLFIGNQSSPFALASALDVPRVCELDGGDAAPFYMGEEKYSKNISFIK